MNKKLIYFILTLFFAISTFLVLAITVFSQEIENNNSVESIGNNNKDTIYNESNYINVTKQNIDDNKKNIRPIKQYDKNDPTTWLYFNIYAKTLDDSIFVLFHKDIGNETPPESYLITVNITDPEPNNQWIYLGGEGNEGSKQYPWSQLSTRVQVGLLNWKASNKENLTKSGYNYASVFVESIKKIRLSDFISPPQREREIVNSVSYINPYFNFFGGEALGIPFKRGFGISIQMGTPYSGPLETDMIAGYFHLLGASVGITTRVDKFILNRAIGVSNSTFGNYNNIFTPQIGLDVNYVIPFGNFLQVGYFAVIDTGGTYEPPELVRSQVDTNKFMPNNVLNKGGYFNFEFRYPLRILRSTRSKIYIAKAFGEFHAGFIGRELTAAGSVFDLRINATFSSARRNFQLLFEAYISSLGEGYSLSSFAMGPSIRLSQTPSGKFGVIAVLVNARLKIGDFYDER